MQNIRLDRRLPAALLARLHGAGLRPTLVGGPACGTSLLGAHRRNGTFATVPGRREVLALFGEGQCSAFPTGCLSTHLGPSSTADSCTRPYLPQPRGAAIRRAADRGNRGTHVLCRMCGSSPVPGGTFTSSMLVWPTTRCRGAHRPLWEGSRTCSRASAGPSGRPATRFEEDALRILAAVTAFRRGSALAIGPPHGQAARAKCVAHLGCVSWSGSKKVV